MQTKIVIGLALTLIILIFIPVYWATEPGRQATAREQFQRAAEERGAELFASHCAVCHGAAGEGNVGPALRGITLDENPLTRSISRGVPGTLMPAFATEEGGPLEHHQIQDVVTLILSWDDAMLAPPSPTPASTHAPTPTSAATPAVPPAPTPSSIDAAAIYAARCALCHGDKRQGHPDLGPALTPGSLAPLTDAGVNDIIKNGKISGGMPPWEALLSAGEIDALVQFLKYTEP